jgi:toxin ParE1/3/4
VRRAVVGAQARRDLHEAWDFIAQRDVDAADRLLAQVEVAVAMLANVPGAGHARSDVRDPRLRFWVVRPYVIAYRYTSRTLTVVRVVHGARDFRKVFRR